MSSVIKTCIMGVVGVVLGLTAGYWLGQKNGSTGSTFLSSFVETPAEVKRPLLAYTIPQLSKREYQASSITINEVIADHPTYTSYLFTYVTLGKKMSGQLNVPKSLPNPTNVKTIVMLRGYVPLTIYETGVGTKNAAAQLAAQGYLTVSPDFFGYGESNPEPSDSWQARFEKPITVIELIKTLEEKPVIIPAAIEGDALETQDLNLSTTQVGMWAHSNGGQIALTTLEILQRPIPTTLWAPVTAPFPYSILFFSDESDDEGKGLRKWLTQFEKEYDVFDFTLTQHLTQLRGPLQLHHGTADEAALSVWSDEFVDKIKMENKRRRSALEELVASGSAELTNPPADLQPIEINYFTYPGADHNLQPGWNTVVERDLDFFATHLDN